MNENMRTKLLWISGAATAAIMLVMNLVLIPGIEAFTEGIRCFDMQAMGYTHETAMEFLSLLGEEGRALYLHRQLPLDFIYPITYTVFFLLLIRKLRPSDSTSKGLVWYAPFCLLPIFDYAENICTVKMLTAANTAGWDLTSEIPSEVFTSFASTITVIKSGLMYLGFAMVIVLLGMKLWRKYGNRR